MSRELDRLSSKLRRWCPLALACPLPDWVPCESAADRFATQGRRSPRLSKLQPRPTDHFLALLKAVSCCATVAAASDPLQRLTFTRHPSTAGEAARPCLACPNCRARARIVRRLDEPRPSSDQARGGKSVRISALAAFRRSPIPRWNLCIAAGALLGLRRRNRFGRSHAHAL